MNVGEAFNAAFTVGVTRVFAAAALLTLACAVLAWFGLRTSRRGRALPSAVKA